MIRKLIAAGAIAMTLATGPAGAETDPLHSDWDDLLGTYVVEGEDGVNLFNYGGLKANFQDTAKLNAYLEQFHDLDFDTLTPDEQFAAYSNIYNALTIQHMIGRYPVKSIRSGHLVGPWKKVFTVIDGEQVSLDDIEHAILRVQFDDPRVHYAVNCASYGCPNLQTEAWVAETLDEDLDQAARDFINHPRGVTVRRNGSLQVSTIYKWFKEDFGGSNDGVIEHLREYAEGDLAEALKTDRKIRKHEYDWALNDYKDPTS
ncbi:MAG: DUF547 domain-containing protein [Henriciella sp.]|nr:DUF547 domain-containing protein [Henriciella sp.]